MLITAAMIVRDEEAFLDECLESLKGVVDEIVIVDTGSKDRSREIAARHGARVFDFPWINDFAAARNYALEQSRGKWILYIDADERVRAGTVAGLRARLEDPSALAEYVWLQPRPNHTAYRVLRLFRNHPDIRFEGVIHESMWPSLNQFQDSAGGDIGLSDLVLDHYGYEGDLTKKHHRNLPLLLRAVAADPRRIYAWSHLSETYLALGHEAAAFETWEMAIETVRRSDETLGDAELPFIGLLQFEFARGNQPAALLREARNRFPQDIHLIRLEGEWLMKSGQHARAIPCFERILSYGDVDRLELTGAYDRRLFNLYAYKALATCYFKLEDYRYSARYHGLAASCDPGSREHLVKAALCARLDRQVLCGVA